MKNERLIALVDCLLLGGRKTAEELAKRFGVTVRTIYRDIDSLSATGVPIVAEAGMGGGFSIEEGYRIDRSFLSPEEVADLRSLLEAFTRATRDRGLEHSLGKITSLGPRGRELTGRKGSALLSRPIADSQSSDPRALGPRDSIPARKGGLPPPLIADLSPWGGPGCDRQILGGLRRAIPERRLVSFRYFDSERKESQREVEPFSVVVGGATWYLHGFCLLRGAFRLFKISRMRDFRLLPASYDPWARVPVPSPFAFLGSEQQAAEIELSVEEGQRPALDEMFPDGCKGPDGKGGWIYRFDYPLGPFLVSLLLQFGAGLRVNKPEGLRIELRDAARRIAEKNEFPESP